MGEYTLTETHPDFQLNKKHFTNEQLKQVAYSYIKEGEEFEEKIGKFLLDWLDASASIEVKTSGSTGAPKSIQLKKEHMRNSAMATAKFFNMPASSTALLCLPATYIAGKMMLVRAMVLGWKLEVVAPTASPLDTIYKTFDFCAMTPFQLDNSMGRLHIIKKLIVGGGAVSRRLQNLVKDIKTKVYETYGMTETITHIAAKRLNPKKKEKEKAFKILPNITISKDKRDCLVIKAPKIADAPIVTNDVVEILTYKKFVWKGRLDNVVNSGGIKLHPEEIEKKLGKILSERFFVSSLADDALGNKLILLVESDFSESKLKELQMDIQQLKALDKYEIPKKIYLIQKFEETSSGKIHRQNTLQSQLPQN